MSMIYGVNWTGVLEFCGHARDGLDGLAKTCEWRNLMESLSDDQLEYCQDLITHGSLGFSLPELGVDISTLYGSFSASLEDCSYAKFSLQVNKALGGILHVWRDFASLGYASLGSVEDHVELACELSDMVGNVAELAKEVGESAWHVSYESVLNGVGGSVRCVFISEDGKPAKSITKDMYETAAQGSYNRGWLLCLKTAAIVSAIALGVIGIATLLGQGALVGALITPAGVLALGSAALVLKVAGNIFEKMWCPPCVTC